MINHIFVFITNDCLSGPLNFNLVGGPLNFLPTSVFSFWRYFGTVHHMP